MSLEFAIAFPFMCLVFGAVVEFGLMMWAKNHMVWAVRRACRRAAVRTTEAKSKVVKSIREDLAAAGLVPASPPSVTEERDKKNPEKLYAVVSVRCDYSVKLLSLLLGRTQRWEVETRMRKEDNKE